ncbi:MAG: hypothetical protein ACREDF_02640 [Thermoplasmata archaeon]
MDSDRFAGSLMTAGGILGLVGTVSTFFPFSVLGVVSFGLVLVFGVLVFRNRPEARLVAAATLWFAPLGGAACVIVLWFNRGGWFHSDLWDVQGSIGLFGMGLALLGAISKRRGIRI